MLRPTIIIDTREKNRLVFTTLQVETGTLQTGDYSLRNLEHMVCVERKSLTDLLACVTAERNRFKRELQRIRAYRFRCLVIETTQQEIEHGGWKSKILPQSVLGSLAAWTAQYNLPIWLAGTHEAAGHFVERYLYQVARVIAAEHETITGFMDASQ